jgi:hypothetical protein
MGKEGIDGVKFPAPIGLYRDVMSVNTARRGEDRSIKLGLEQNGKPEAETESQMTRRALSWKSTRNGWNKRSRFLRAPRSISCNNLVLFDLPGRNQVAFHMHAIRNYIHKT